MSTIVYCRTCCLELTLPAGADLVTCAACGTNNCRPQAEGDAQDKLARATRQRLDGDFHNAEISYQHVLLEYPEEHEALWGLAQCRYGVEYVQDRRTNRRMPVVNLPHPRPMQTDPDFIHACELAPEDVRAQYERDAEYVDKAMARIRDLAEDCPAYDIFLCHKTTKANGEGYTEDYNRAVQLTRRLEQLGYRVFFAPFADLEPGENYEAGIYHALCTSKLMLLVCSDPEFITSPWVKSEWTRFFEMMNSDASKHLIPLMYGGMSEGRLPRDIRTRHLQSIRMEELDAGDRLLRSVEKYVGPARTPAPQAPAPAPAAAPVSPSGMESLLQELMSAYGANGGSVQESDFATEPVRGGGCLITGYTGSSRKLTIPATLGGQPVVAIDAGAFSEAQNLAEVTLPASVTNVASSAFNECAALTALHVAAGNPKYRSVDGVLVDNAGQLCIYPCGRTDRKYVVPDSVTTIGRGAFQDCANLVEIVLPEGVTEIGEAAFWGCTALAQAAFPQSLQTIGESAFRDCSSLQAARLRWKVTSIGGYAFHSCSSLRELELPPGLTVLEESVFSNCTSLKELTIPKGVTAIRDFAFSSCASLTHVTIPRSVTELGIGVFSGCPGLTLSVYRKSAGHQYASIHDAKYEFLREDGEREISFQTRRVTGGHIITGCTCPEATLTVPERIDGARVVAIDPGAFSNCPALQELRLPKNWLEIADGAFSGCTTLRRITVDEENPRYSVKQGALVCHEKLLWCSPEVQGVYRFPSGSIRHVAKEAFAGCQGLTGVELPSRLQTIGAGAFRGCTALLRVNIPDSVSTIDPDAFAGCPNLILTVGADSAARRYAQQNGLRCELRGAAPAAQPQAQPQVQPQAQPQPQSQSFAIPAQPVASGPAAREGDFTIVPLQGGCEIQQYNGSDAMLTIPASIGGQRVVSIGEDAFSDNTTLTSVYIPDSVTHIGPYAFSGCTALTQIRIPESVTTIGRRAFKNCKALQYMQLPSRLTRIEEGLLGSCHELQTVVIPAAVTSIGTKAFNACRSLDHVTLPAGLTDLGEGAFSACRALRDLQVAPGNIRFHMQDGVLMRQDGVLLCCPGGREDDTYIVPSDVTVIAEDAFWGNKHIAHVSIPAGVTQIAPSAFVGCRSLCRITIAPGNPVYTVRNDMLCHVDGTLMCALPGHAEHTVPAGTTRIGDYAFTCCEDMVKVTLPRSVVSIGERSFWYCKALKSITLPANVRSIGDSAFHACSSLTSVSLPASLVSIGRSAFVGCTALSSITIPPSVANIGEYCFNECESLRSVTLPRGLTELGKWLFADCPALEEVVLPAGLTRIGNCAFRNCTALRRISIPSSVTEVGESAFEGCTSLTELPLPAGVTRIAPSTFFHCTGLTSLPISPSVTQIGEFAYSECTSLRRVQLPPHVTHIDQCAFYRCSALNSVILPPVIQKIGDYAFDGCGGASMVMEWEQGSATHAAMDRYTCDDEFRYRLQTPQAEHYKAPRGPLNQEIYTVAPISGGCAVTSYKGPGGAISIPAVINGQKVVAIADGAFAARQFMPDMGVYLYLINDTITSVTIPEGVQMIGDDAFNNCTSLSRVVLPESLRRIGKNAFHSCKALKDVNIPKGVTAIGASAFGNCELLKLPLSVKLRFMASKIT